MKKQIVVLSVLSVIAMPFAFSADCYDLIDNGELNEPNAEGAEQNSPGGFCGVVTSLSSSVVQLAWIPVCNETAPCAETAVYWAGVECISSANGPHAECDDTLTQKKVLSYSESSCEWPNSGGLDLGFEYDGNGNLVSPPSNDPTGDDCECSGIDPDSETEQTDEDIPNHKGSGTCANM